MKKNLHSKSCENKRGCDLHGKNIKNKGDVDLYIGCKSWDKIVWGFVFKKTDKNSRGTKNSVIFGEGIVNQCKDNSILLIC